MVHLRKSNSFRRTIKDMEKEADEIDDQITGKNFKKTSRFFC